MSNLSQFLASTSPMAIVPAGPGSNGYWRREMWLRAGSFSFTVKKSGKMKIYAGGAAGGGGRKYPGASAGMACDERDYFAGDVITVTIGVGGIGAAQNVNGGDGGTTSVVCAARGLNLVLTGASGGRENGTGMGAGAATGGNIFNRSGAAPAAAGVNLGFGGASSASPFGPGFASAKWGGAGWGGPSNSGGGASSHRASLSTEGADGGLSKGGFGDNSGSTYPRIDNGESQPWWDLTDFDGGGGASWGNAGGKTGSGGIGSGGGSNHSTAGLAYGGSGGIGGGGGAAGQGGNGGNGGSGGNCAGGGATTSDSNHVGGKGGDGLCIIYWDEVQL